METIPVDGREVSILLVKNPAGANEVLRTLTLEDGALDLWLALNDRIADGRDVSWIWDADFELLAGRVRRATCAGTRAEEMALRLKYAGIDAELEVERDLGALARRRGRAPPASGCSRSPPTRRCSSCATCSPGAGWPSGGRSDGRRRVWHDVECAAYAADLPLWRALADEADGPCSTSAAAPAASRSTWPQRGHEVNGTRLRPRPARRAGRARASAG